MIDCQWICASQCIGMYDWLVGFYFHIMLTHLEPFIIGRCVRKTKWLSLPVALCETSNIHAVKEGIKEQDYVGSFLHRSIAIRLQQVAH